MIVYVDSKPLALPFSSLDVGTAQGDMNYRDRPLCSKAGLVLTFCFSVELEQQLQRFPRRESIDIDPSQPLT